MALNQIKQRGRRVERIRFADPLPGRLGDLPVVLTDISLLGARVEHQTQVLAGSEAILTFVWQEETVLVDTKVIRCKLERATPGAAGVSIFHSGLQFLRTHGSSGEALQNLVASHIVRALDEQKANARGVRRPVEAADEFAAGMHLTHARRGSPLDSLAIAPANPLRIVKRSSGYWCLRLENQVWRRLNTMNPEQPPDGFTVCLEEDQEHVEMLCETYSRADVEGRRLIRLFAQLSIARAGAPRGRYVP